MDIETLWRIVDEGSTPAIAVIAYFLWRVDKRLAEHMAEVRASQKSRDEKIGSIHDDIGAMIRRIANMNGGE